MAKIDSVKEVLGSIHEPQMHSVAAFQESFACGFQIRRLARGGFNLLELLVVIVLCGTLMGLVVLSLAVGRSRSRQLQCIHHLSQQAKSVLAHEAAQNLIPTGGWGSNWIGMSDRGFKEHQPGGWIFNLLPFCEQGETRTLAPASTIISNGPIIRRFADSTIPMFICPERSLPVSIRVSTRFRPPIGVELTTAARADYAVNAGGDACRRWPGPLSLSDGDSQSFDWPSTDSCNGVSFRRSRIRVRDLRDGASKVLLCGEKWASTAPMGDEGMNQPWSSGDSADTRRLTLRRPVQDGVGMYIGAFGSAHSVGANFAFCDGSVRMFTYSGDETIFQGLGGRDNGG